MLSAPLCFSGAFAGLYLTGHEMSLFAQIGLVALMGIVMKNGILLVDRANQLRATGLNPAEAMAAAGPERLRPVLMTTVATVLGHFPLVLVSGPGAEARNSIGLVLVSGMAIGTLFTLFVVPSIYVFFARDHRPAAAGS